MMRPHVLRWVVALVCLVSSLRMGAQELRDPTMPPSEVGARSGAPAQAGPGATEGMAVVVREGKSFLVVGTRLYAPGQKIGPARIERITETEVWLREGKTLRKVPRFAGIQRRAVVATPACGPGTAAMPPVPVFPGAKASAPSRNRKASPAAPCGGTQP